MSTTRKSIFKGIKEVGQKVGATPTPIAKTTVDGVKIAISTTELVIEAAESDFPIDVLQNASSAVVTGTFQSGDLRAMLFAMGLDSSALVGDLTGATPSAETLSILANTLGEAAPCEFYVKGSGPSGVGTRTWTIKRGKVNCTGDITLGRNNIVTIPFKITALDTLDGSAIITIEDAVA